MKTTEEGNKLIAEFMELSIQHADNDGKFPMYESHKGEYTMFDELCYHKSYDWLMPVVEKINGMYHRITIEGNEEEDRCVVLCYDENGKLDHEVYECGLNLLEATYKAIIEFIE